MATRRDFWYLRYRDRKDDLWDLFLGTSVRSIEHRREIDQGDDTRKRRRDRYAIDKSESSYAINRPRAADCTSFSYLWPLC